MFGCGVKNTNTHDLWFLNMEYMTDMKIWNELIFRHTYIPISQAVHNTINHAREFLYPASTQYNPTLHKNQIWISRYLPYPPFLKLNTDESAKGYPEIEGETGNG